jgi:hypothetical protein
LPWNTYESLIGESASIYAMDGGFFIPVGNKEFKPSDDKLLIKSFSEKQNLVSLNPQFAKKPRKVLLWGFEPQSRA